MNKLKKTILFLALSIFSSAYAQEVSQVKGTKALLKLNGSSAEVGQEFYAMDANGKKKALLKIRQIKNDKAVAEITKGQAEPGFSITPRTNVASPSTAANKQQEQNQEEESNTKESRSQKTQRAKRPRGFLGQILRRNTNAGFIGGLSQNTMSLTAKKNSSSEDITMTGMSYNIAAFYDIDLSQMFTARLKGGIFNYDAKTSTSTTAVCSDSSNCEIGYMYLDGEASAHFNIIRGPTRFWIGGGMAFLFALTKKNTVSNLDTANSTNQMFLFGGGADIGLSDGAMIPVSLDYGFFPSSSGVKASSLILRAGYGWRF